MFETLSERLSNLFSGLVRRDTLSESDVHSALREIRRALIEADVALPVVLSFIDKVGAEAVGKKLVGSVTAGEMMVKIVHDHLVEMLGKESAPLTLPSASAPLSFMFVGLQGSGKTTTAAKIAYRFTRQEKKKILLASLDTRRPAAQEQLQILGKTHGIDTLPIIPGQSPVEIAQRAKETATRGEYDAYFLDTAGRLHIDAALMEELVHIREVAHPQEILLVADSLTGQDALHQAERFDALLGLTGVILTRLDGDGRGGAALSIRAATGKPVRLIGVGEKIDALEDFHPERIASRILGMGDIVSFVEKALEVFEKGEQGTEEIEARLKKGNFNLNDFAFQIRQMQKMGGVSKLLGFFPKLIPGMGALKGQVEATANDKIFKKHLSIIDSMTPLERTKPELLKASRKKRIAAGSGTSLQEINTLLKTYSKMAEAARFLAQQQSQGGLTSLFGGKKGEMALSDALKGAHGLGKGGGGGLPSLPPELMEAGGGSLSKLLKGMTGGFGGFAKGGLPDFPSLGEIPQGTGRSPVKTAKALKKRRRRSR